MKFTFLAALSLFTVSFSAYAISVSVSPTSGVPGTDLTITVSGVNSNDAASGYMDFAQCGGGFVQKPGGSFHCKAPSHAAGAAKLKVVTGANGSAETTFNYNAQNVIPKAVISQPLQPKLGTVRTLSR